MRAVSRFGLIRRVRCARTVVKRLASGLKGIETKSFAMSGSGWLWPFYLGVLKTMRAHGCLNEQSHAAGTSGGSLGAMCAMCDIDPEIALDHVISLSKKDGFLFNIDGGLKDSVRAMLPSDALDRCNGRLHVVTTKLWPNPSSSPTITSQFKEEEDLIDHIAASCFIPGANYDA